MIEGVWLKSQINGKQYRNKILFVSISIRCLMFGLSVGVFLRKLYGVLVPISMGDNFYEIKMLETSTQPSKLYMWLRARMFYMHVGCTMCIFFKVTQMQFNKMLLQYVVFSLDERN